MNFKKTKGFDESKFEEQEGFLYTSLHQLEQDALLTSRWDDDGSKYYVLNKKGHREKQNRTTFTEESIGR